MTSETRSDERPPRVPPAYRLVALESVDSTNDEARRRALEGAEEGTLVWAREQTSGHGRRGRRWESPRGNLYCSIVLRPECDLNEAAQFSFIAALALSEAIGSVAPPMLETTFKWPNDVLVNGRKVSGILLESGTDRAGRLDWLVLGIGVNISSYPEDTTTEATSLAFEGCPSSVTDVALLEAFTRSFLAWANRWQEDGFTPVREGWVRHAHRLGETIEVRVGENRFTGIFNDLDEAGALVLATGSGERRITAGDVFFGDQSDHAAGD